MVGVVAPSHYTSELRRLVRGCGVSAEGYDGRQNDGYEREKGDDESRLFHGISFQRTKKSTFRLFYCCARFANLLVKVLFVID